MLWKRGDYYDRFGGSCECSVVYGRIESVLLWCRCRATIGQVSREGEQGRSKDQDDS